MLWQKAFGATAAAIVLSCSLAWCSTEDPLAISLRLDEAKTPEAMCEVAQEALRLSQEPAIRTTAEDVLRTRGMDPKANDQLRHMAFVYASWAVVSEPLPRDAKAEAEKIKQNLLVADPDSRENSNWLGKAMERLRDLNWPDFDTPTPNPPSFAAGRYVVMGVWFLLGAAVLLFGFLAVRRFVWKRGLLAVKRPVLAEDEPDRTVSEWFDLARDLEGSGRFREACRAVYIGCLVAIDHAGIARFHRGQTNWEHQRRIDAHPVGQTLGFAEATKRFDRVWYGSRTASIEDVHAFWHHLELVQKTMENGA